jgi:hypothetical protein
MKGYSNLWGAVTEIKNPCRIPNILSENLIERNIKKRREGGLLANTGEHDVERLKSPKWSPIDLEGIISEQRRRTYSVPICDGRSATNSCIAPRRC